MSDLLVADSANQKQVLLHDPAEDDKLDLLEYWRSINKRKLPILGFGLAIAVLAAVIVFVMTPVYRSTVTVLIEAGKVKLVNVEDIYSGATQNREYYQTQIEIIKSREVAIRTIINTKLWEADEFDPRVKDSSWLGSLRASIGFGDADTDREWTEAALAEAVYPRFAGRLAVEPIRLSQLAKISFEAADPRLAARVANAAAQMYVENDLEARYRMTQQASSWLQGRLSSVKKRLDESERALQDYREKEGIVDVKSLAQSGAGRQIEDTMTRLAEARMKRAEIENIYRQIKAAPKGADLSSIPAILRNPLVSDAKRQEGLAERKLSELAQRYASEHPKYQQAEGDLMAAKDFTHRQVDIVVDSIVRDYELARGTEQALEGVLGAAKGTVQSLNRKEFELSVLEREVQANRQMYDMFLQRAKETSISGDLQSPVARIVDPAVVSNVPVKPKKTQIVMIALVLGLLFAAVVSLLLDRLDNTLKTTEDVEGKLKQPLLTTLPMLSAEEVERTSTARIFLDQPKSLYAEAIRTARTGVLLSAIDLPRRTLLVTSSLPGEGKTTFSINLAIAHAHTKKTLLIDADMRRPTVCKGLGLPVGTKGLSSLVSGAAPLSECVQKIEGSTLMVMPSGPIPPNPLELLLSHRFEETLQKLSEVFDVIVIDSPPVELVSDALVISAKATGVVYVTRAHKTPHQLARKGMQRIRRAGGQILGVVLNSLDFEKAEKYYGEYSGYGKYGYGTYGYQGGYSTPYAEETNAG